jgi:hypothetical protein
MKIREQIVYALPPERYAQYKRSGISGKNTARKVLGRFRPEPGNTRANRRTYAADITNARSPLNLYDSTSAHKARIMLTTFSAETPHAKRNGAVESLLLMVISL